MIIGITGKIGSGKSTTATYLQEKYNYTEYSFASPLKEIGSIFQFTQDQLYGTQENKLEVHPHWGISSRTFLQRMGTEMFREYFPKVFPEIKLNHSIWIELFRLKYISNPKNYVISDVRFLDEANAIKEMGGVIIRTIRNNNVSSDSKQEHLHASETELERIVSDFTLDNNESITASQLNLDKIVSSLSFHRKNNNENQA